MIDEADRERAERWAWWFLVSIPSVEGQRGFGCMDWFLSREMPPSPLGDDELDDLLTRTWRRLQEYKVGSDYEPSAEDYAEWIGLDLGGVFETAGKLTQVLVERAMAHGRGRVQRVLQRAHEGEVTRTVDGHVLDQQTAAELLGLHAPSKDDQ